MEAIENHQLKGITVKNVVVTIISTASIVASVMTSYYSLRAEIQAIKSSGETETRVTDLRLKVIENEVVLLQKEIDEIQFAGKAGATKRNTPIKSTDPPLLSAIQKR